MKKYFTTNQIRKAVAFVLAVVLLVAAVPFGARKALAVYSGTGTENFTVHVTDIYGHTLDGVSFSSNYVSEDKITLEAVRLDDENYRTTLNISDDTLSGDILITASRKGFKDTIVNCGSFETPATAGIIEAVMEPYFTVTVTDNATGSPISEAKVSLSGDRDYTGLPLAEYSDADGLAVFPTFLDEIATGFNDEDLKITVTAEKEGYDTVAVSDLVLSNSGVAPTAKAITMKKSVPKRDLIINIKDKNNKPLSGVGVTVTNGTHDPEHHAVFNLEGVSEESNEGMVFSGFNHQTGSYTQEDPLLIKITASKEGYIVLGELDDIPVYEGSSLEFDVTMAKQRSEFISFEAATVTKAFADESYTQTITGSRTEEPADIVTYEITSQKATDPGVKDVASIDSNSGKVTFLAAGEIVVTATASNAEYADATASYTLTITKSNQNEWALKAPATLYFGETATLEATGGKGNGKITFTVSPADGTAADAVTVGTQEDNKLPITSNVKSGSITVTAKKGGNGGYNESNTDSKIITLSQKDITGGYTLKDSDGNELTNGENVWFTGNVIITAAENYLVSESEKTGYTNSITVSGEGLTTKEFYVRENNTSAAVTGAISKVKTETIRIDKTAPAELSFQYPNPISTDGTEEVYYYDKAAELTFSASDAVSEISKIEYWLPDNATETPSKTITDTTASITIIPIPLGSDGKVKIKVTDNAGNTAETESKRIVVDATVPTVEVSYSRIPVAVTDPETGITSYYFNHPGKDNDPSVTVTIKAVVPFFDQTYMDGLKITAVDAKGSRIELNDGFSNFEFADGVWTSTCKFTQDGFYKFSDIHVKSKTGVQNTAVNYTGTVEDAFVIDTTVPKATITISGTKGAEPWEKSWNSLDNSEFEWNKEGSLFSNGTVTVKLDLEDETAGIDPAKVEWLFSTDVLSASDLTSSSLTWETVSVSEWDPATLTIKGSYTKEFDTQEQFIIYLKLTDKAGNASFFATNGVTLDIDPAVIEADGMAPVVSLKPLDPVNGTSNTDVTMSLTVTDPNPKEGEAYTNIYSGLELITYQIENADTGEVTGFGEVKKFALSDYVINADSEGDKYSNPAAIVVPANEKNNGNSIIVSVTAKDRAGNETTTQYALSIDTTAPVIELSYDPVAAANEHGGKSFFNTNRTATITVTERNFDPSTMVLEVKKDGAAYTGAALPADLSGWKKTAGEAANGDDTKYSAAVTFAEDGDYEIVSLSCTDLAGNASHGFAFTKDADGNEPDGAKKFTIDKTAPVLTIAYDNNNSTGDKNGNPYYFQEKRIVTLTLTERNFDPADASLVNIASAPEAAFSGWKLVEGSDSADANKRQYTATISFTADGDYTFKVPSYSDLAANKGPAAAYAAGTKAPGAFNIDTVDPVISVKYDNNNQTGTKDSIPVFQAGRTAAITITERNFDASLVALTARNTNTGKVYTVDRWTNPDGDKTRWTAELVFDEEGRYDFQISCKDLSGRMSDPEKSVFAGGTKGGNSFIVDLKNPGAPVIEYPTPANKYEKIDAENGAESGDEKAAEETPEMMYFYPEAVVLEIHTSDTLYGSGIDHLTVKLPGVKEEITIPASELVFAKPADVGGAKGVVTIYARIPGAKEPKGAAKEASLTVPIDPNCEDKVIVTAVDKAGRKSVLNDVTQKPEEDGPVSAYDDHITVVTDNTAPVMTVQFDNNSANNMDGFYWFKAGRTMTVTITEKYFEYNKNRVVLTVSKKDHKEDAWTSENWSGKLSFTKVEGKEDSYEAKVSFPDDSFYQITELYYADPATNWAGYKAAAASEAKVPAHNDIEYRDSLAGAEKEFAVDKTPAVINVSIDNNDVQNGMYFKAPRTYTITITERNFNQDPALKLLALNAQKKAFTETVFSGITVPTFSKNGDVYTAAMTFPGDAEYQFAVSYTDQAGNNTPTAVYAAGTQSQADFIVDRTAPAVKVTYDNNNARNEKVFKADRTMTLTVTDEYFDPARANLTFTVKATDQAGKAVGIEDMQAKLRDPASWTNSGAVHTATLLFTEEANYEISMGLTDLAGNANTAVDAAGQAAPFEFTIDKTIPTAAIQVGDFTASRNGTPWNDKVLDSFTFSLFSNKLLSVSISSGDELSGVEQVEYIVTDEKLTNDALRARTDWQKGAPESFSFPITKDAHFIVYVRLNDRAGNERLLSTDGVTVDTTATVVEKVAPVVTIDPVQPVNDIYNGNVMFDVYAEDPDVGGVYSGLRKVEYVIYNLSVSATEPSASGTLYSFDKEYAEKHEAMRVYNIGQAITAIAADNNANEVLVRVTATDMAGNSASKETTVKIDITKPTIDIRYDNNSARQSPYYKAPRTATITIHERNFDPARVSITAEAKDSGAKAVLSDWTRTGGTGNLDDTVWTAELFFVEDGDYSFTISMTDEAGNPSQDAVFTGSDPEQFVIDRTKAAVSVSYKDTQEDPVYKDGFYKAPRTATIKIDDVNFDPEDVKITLTGALDGKEITVPVLSSWTGNGTVYTATLDFSEDGDYAFTLNFEDKAGNVSEQYGEVSFTVDKTRPELEISGVEDASANKGQVIPVITYSDVNADADSFEFKLYDSAGNEVTSFVDENGNAASVDSMLSTKEIAHGIELTIANIPDAKDNDDIYTLKAVVLDNAGNETAKEIRFSVNRYGSNFEILDNLEAELNGKYVQKGRELRIRETNADELVGKKIIIYKNNETIELEEGKGYRVEEEGGDGKWLTYTYTIFAENFADDAVYRVVVHSEDAAGNIAENTQDSKGKPLSFVVDHTAPLVTVIDLESGKTYAEENKEVHFSAVDNLRLSEVVVTLDGEEKYRFTAEDIQKALEQNEDLSFIVPGDSTRAHAVQITAIDQAGNQFTEEVSDFFVTTNLFVRYFNNKGLFFGSLGGFTGLLALLIILLAARKKKQDKDGKAA